MGRCSVGVLLGWWGRRRVGATVVVVLLVVFGAMEGCATH